MKRSAHCVPTALCHSGVEVSFCPRLKDTSSVFHTTINTVQYSCYIVLKNVQNIGKWVPDAVDQIYLVHV